MTPNPKSIVTIIEVAAQFGLESSITSERKKDICDGIFHLSSLLLVDFGEADDQRNYSRLNLEIVRDIAEEGSIGQRGFDSAFENIIDSAGRVLRFPGELP